MRRTVSVILILVIVAGFAAPGYCRGSGRKLMRGLANCATFYMEIPHRISEKNNESGLYDAFTLGAIKGFAMALFRGVAGMYETATFYFPMPENYEPFINDPESFIKLPDVKEPDERK